MTTAVPAKDVRENIPIEFDFTSDLGAETITAIAMTVVPMVGADVAPSGLLNGSPTSASGIVTQWVHAGVSGVIYHVICQVTTSGGRILVLTASLPVSG